MNEGAAKAPFFMLMKTKINWGILGPGRIAERFCEALATVSDAAIHAVASTSLERASLFGQKHNIAKHYGNYEAFMLDKDVDIVYIATPHVFHYPQALACLEAGKHVLCEKPLTMSFAQTERLTSIAGNKGLFLMEGLWSAFMPAVKEFLRLAGNGNIGDLKLLTADFGFYSSIDTESRHFNRLLGGGSILDIGVYPLYLSLALLGKPQRANCLASISNGIDLSAAMSLHHAKGVFSQLFSSLNVDTQVIARLFGTKGTLTIPSAWFKSTSLQLRDDTGNEKIFEFPHLSNGFEHEIMAVNQDLLEGRTQNATMPHSLSLLLAETMDEMLRQAGVDYGEPARP